LKIGRFTRFFFGVMFEKKTGFRLKNWAMAEARGKKKVGKMPLVKAVRITDWGTV